MFTVLVPYRAGKRLTGRPRIRTPTHVGIRWLGNGRQTRVSFPKPGTDGTLCIEHR